VLPPGQKARSDFPRFGLPQYAARFPTNTHDLSLDIAFNSHSERRIDLSSGDFPRCTVTADFHCVTTWSYVGANWGGVKFLDFFERIVGQLEDDGERLTGAVFYAQDGYKTSLLLEDLLGEEVMLADTLDGQPLSIEHGAPIRLVAPEHYGYKNLKHLSRIEFYSKMPVVKRGIRAFLDHPRARVLKEERSRWVPGWILRHLYKRLITGTVKDFQKAMRLP